MNQSFSRASAPACIRIFFSFLTLVVLFSCHFRPAGQTYWFVQSGPWRQPKCWRNGNMPGGTVNSYDTVQILSNVQCIVDSFPSVTDYGVIYVYGGLVINDSFLVATQGQMYFEPKAQVIGNGYFGSGGLVAIGPQATINLGTFMTAPGGSTNNNGTLRGGSLQIQSRFVNGPAGILHVLSNDSASIAQKTDSFINSGTVLLDGAMAIVSSGDVNSGIILCDQRARLWLGNNATLVNSYVIRLTDNSSLNLLQGSQLDNRDSLLNGGNATIDNKGTVTSENYIGNISLLKCEGGGSITVGTEARIYNAYRLGKIQMQGPGALNLLPRSIIQNDDSIWTDQNVQVNNQGTILNGTYMNCGGALINKGNFVMSTGAQSHIVSPIRLIIGDTLFNPGTFTYQAGQVSGSGPIIVYFQGTIKGYSGGNVDIYRIVTQPVNYLGCGGPVCNAVFSVVASGKAVGYQWQLSTDNGGTWQSVPTGGQFSGGTTARLSIQNASLQQQGYLYRCQLSGPGVGNMTITNSVTVSNG